MVNSYSNGSPSLDEKEKKILASIIDYHLSHGESVGSRTLVRKYGLDSSPATIRNIMSDLEESGYIEKTHTSSGRLPTSKGYKYYVNNLLEVEELSNLEISNIKRAYSEKTKELEKVLSKSTKLLSEMTHCAGIALEPSISQSDIKKVEFISLDDRTVLAVIVTKTLAVRTKKIFLDKEIDDHQLNKISREINGSIEEKRLNSFLLESGENRQSFKANFADYCLGEIEPSFHIKESHEGTDQNSFPITEVLTDSGEGVRRLLEDLVKKEKIKSDGINIILGSDLDVEYLKGMTLIVSSYNIEGSKGIIGVLGPTRMEYSKVAGLVSYVADEVTKISKKRKKVN